MICSNCGKQIPDNTMFCNYCGTQQAAVNQPENADTQAQEPKEKPKKTVNIFIILAVVLCAFLIGKFVIAPAMVSDSGKDSGTGNQGGQSQQFTPSNPEYEAIFDDTNIVHFQTPFNMDTKSFALKNEDGSIFCIDVGYKGDVIKHIVTTGYILISEYTDAEKTELENTLKPRIAEYDALNCGSATYRMSANYCIITSTLSDMDKAENYGELYHAQLLEENTFISMSETESMLLEDGFVMK